MANFKMKNIPSALTIILGAGISGSLLMASGAYAQQRIEKIEVTGTNIKRIDTESVAPVEIITRDQIERSGQPTIADVLRNIPSNGGGSYSEAFSNSFAPGASGISLRSLGQKSTLVLINGRRTAGYGFAQNLQDTFVDLNSIPSAAVERVEVLKDGASALYGSDAIAGVVNIILRKDYKGVEVGGGMGAFEGKNDYSFNLTGGMGDLAKDRYTVFGTLDYYKRDLLLQSDTKFLHTRDMRGYAGGRNFQSLTGGGTWRQLNAAGTALTNNNTAITECPGTVMTSAQAVAAGLLASTSTQNLAGNTFCTQDFNGQFTALPKTERLGFLGRATMEFSPTVTGYAELGLSQNKTFQTFQAPFFAGTTGLTPTSAGLRPFTYNINFAPGVAGNPYSTAARYVGVLADMGTRDTDIKSDTFRILAGLNYTAAGWDFDSGIGFAKNEVVSDSINRITLAGTSAAFGVSSASQPPIPTSTASTYNLDRWSTNSQAVRDGIRVNFPRKSDSELSFVDTKASREFGSLAGGPIGLAIGGEFRNEKLKDRPDQRAQAGDILGQGITATDGKRDSSALYAELALPFTKMLEGQVAARFDHYSDYGNSSVPKLGLKFKPTNAILIRANWGKGFRAPTLPEISPSVGTFFTSVIDPTTGASTQISGVFAGNPTLSAEKSTSSTLGIVFEPTKEFNTGLNYYDIDWKNIVAAPSFQSIVNAGGPAVIRDPLTGAIVTVLNGYINQNAVRTKGVDFDARYAMSTTLGKLTVRGNATYVASFKEEGVECVGTNGCTNTYPRTKGTLSLDWDYRSFATTASVNYIHSYYQQLLPGSFFTPGDPRFQNGVYPDRIPRYHTVDLFARYQINRNLTVSASILNAEDKTPPYDPGFSSTNQYDFSLYDIRGRQFHLGFIYKM